MNPHTCSCPAHLSRRTLLGSSASLVAATALSRPAAARGTANKTVLVHLFLRGGMDGLTAVVPYGDDALYGLRPTLAIRPPGQPGGALDLDGFFGLPPTAGPLLTPYNDGRLAIVHAAGSSDETRSHFEAEDRVEYGELPPGAPLSGWAARYLQVTPVQGSSAIRGIGLGSNILPQTLFDAPQTLPMTDFASGFPGVSATSQRRRDALIATYSRRSPSVSAPALDAISSITLSNVDLDNYVPENGAQYPDTEFGTKMRNIAALIKAQVGVECVSLDYGDWDDHSLLGPVSGRMANRLADLTSGLEAFYLDMLGHLDDYLLVGLSEFGRHARENGSLGVDHGHGNAMFVMGDVNGGQVFADWPGLAADQLDNGDLAITTDYRNVIGELLVERLGITDLDPIFPGHTLVPLGLVS